MTLGFTAPEVGVAKVSAAEEMTERKKVGVKYTLLFVSVCPFICLPPACLSTSVHLCLPPPPRPLLSLSVSVGQSAVCLPVLLLSVSVFPLLPHLGLSVSVGQSAICLPV